MAFRNAYANLGSGPKNHHASAVTMAMATTIWTKYAAMMSASFWIGARVRWACADHVHDLREQGIRADPLGAEDERAVAVHRRAGDLARPPPWRPAPVLR